MYIDLIICILLLIIMLVWFKKFDSYIYAFGILDIMLRILFFIKTHMDVPMFTKILGYLPSSLAGLIEKYTSGTLELILLWIIVVLYIIFEYHIIKFFAKKRK